MNNKKELRPIGLSSLSLFFAVRHSHIGSAQKVVRGGVVEIRQLQQMNHGNCLISALIYNRNVDLTSAVPYILPGVIGGAVGALLLCRIKYSWLGRLFAVMVIFAGLCFIL